MNNTSIGILGPLSQFEEKPVIGGSFRILENGAVEPFLKTMVPKAGTILVRIDGEDVARIAGEDTDVQMAG